MDVTTMTTEELVEFCMNDDVTWEEMEPALNELTRRRREMNPKRKTAEEAWAEFVKHYMPCAGDDDLNNEVVTSEPCQSFDEDLGNEVALLEHLVPPELTPSPEGRECLGNGKWPGYECQCDECDYYLDCFPDWEEDFA